MRFISDVDLGDGFYTGCFLDQGGQCEIYTCLREGTDNVYALRCVREDLLFDPAAIGRFETEIEIMMVLSETASELFPIVETIVRKSRIGIAIIMELLNGKSLYEILQCGRALSLFRAIKISIQVLAALEFMHEQGIIYRDLKPGNVFVCSGDRVKVLDFGLAVHVDRVPMEEHAAGTLPFIAPEIFSNPSQFDHRADIYSFGVLLFHILTNENLFNEFLNEVEMIHDANIPEGLKGIIEKAVESDPDKRYKTSRAVALDLLKFTMDAGFSDKGIVEICDIYRKYFK